MPAPAAEATSLDLSIRIPHHQFIPYVKVGDVCFPRECFAYPQDRFVNQDANHGQRLKAGREEQRLTLEKVFEATRIRIQYLQALEADDLSVMPSPVQARGYLRITQNILARRRPNASGMREMNANSLPGSDRTSR
jgi:hypothetical protein